MTCGGAGEASASSSSLAAHALRCRMYLGIDLQPTGTVSGFEFVTCAPCAFSFAPVIRPDTLQTAYSSGWHSHLDGAPQTGWANPSFLEPALQLVDTARVLNILDFGTGHSLIPDILRSRGHRVTAVDIVPPAWPHPDRLTGLLLDLKLPAESFDLAFAFQVFEHLPEPRPILDELLRLTRPGGIVLIHTDMEVPDREQGIENWWYVTPPDRCSFFRHRTFDTVFRDTVHHVAWRDSKMIAIRAGATGAGDEPVIASGSMPRTSPATP